MVELVEMVDATSELAPITRVEMVEMFHDNMSHPPMENFSFKVEFFMLGRIYHSGLNLSYCAIRLNCHSRLNYHTRLNLAFRSKIVMNW